MTLRWSRWPMTVEKRFWLKVWPRGDCWEWRGYRNQGTGYGRFNICGEPVGAHRFAYEAAKGTIPVGLTIDHICRHRWCVKPSHLEVVSSRTNALRGEGPSAKHTQQTACIHGHPFDAANTYVLTNGHRMCRTCRRNRMRLYAAQRKAP